MMRHALLLRAFRRAAVILRNLDAGDVYARIRADYRDSIAWFEGVCGRRLFQCDECYERDAKRRDPASPHWFDVQPQRNCP